MNTFSISEYDHCHNSCVGNIIGEYKYNNKPVSYTHLWNEQNETIVVLPTTPDLDECSNPVYYRRSEIYKAYRNKYPTDAFIIYPDKKGYIAINIFEWLEDESNYIYIDQEAEAKAFTDFFMNHFKTK